jgi:WhiB family redox-sensing transcriptional regulator
MQEGLCRRGELDPNTWYAQENTKEARDATAVCWRCPVRMPCLEYACTTREPFAIWGGVPASERVREDYDFVWLSYLPNVYVRDRYKVGAYSKFADRNLKHDPGDRQWHQDEEE